MSPCEKCKKANTEKCPGRSCRPYADWARGQKKRRRRKDAKKTG